MISLTLFLLTLSFLMLGIGDAGSHTELVKLGGWFGLASAVAALYAAFASVMNSMVERTLMRSSPEEHLLERRLDDMALEQWRARRAIEATELARAARRRASAASGRA